MPRNLSLSLCALGTALISVAYLSAFIPGRPTWGAWSMILGLASLCVGCLALGAYRAGRRSALLTWSLVVSAAAIVTGFGLALALTPAEAPGARLVLGFPVRTAAVLYLVGVVPLVLLPLVYALTFDRLTLTDEDIARVRAARRPDAR